MVESNTLVQFILGMSGFSVQLWDLSDIKGGWKNDSGVSSIISE